MLKIAVVFIRYIRNLAKTGSSRPTVHSAICSLVHLKLFMTQRSTGATAFHTVSYISYTILDFDPLKTLGW